MKVTPINVKFAVGTEIVRGHLFEPEGSGPFPALIFTGPYTGVKEQVTGAYARALAEEGFVTLAFDHRNFGESDGVLRQHENPQGKLDDLGAATSFLQRLDNVDIEKVGAVGICLGGSYALRHAGTDPRIKALATVAAAYIDPYPGDEHAAKSKTEWLNGYANELTLLAQGKPSVIAAVSENPDELVGMPGQEPFDYYGTDRAASPHWRNQVTRLSSYNLATFDAVIGAELLGNTPSIVVHGTNDLFCSPENAEKTFNRMRGEKALHWIETTNHIELYDSLPHVDAAVGHVASWMHKYLQEGS